jgi:hypothetical protein
MANLSTYYPAPITATDLGLGAGSNATFGSLTANNGTLTASAPVLTLAQTWNNASVAFTGLQLNVTNTASLGSGINSKLLEINLDGSPIYRFQRSSSTPYLFIGPNDTGIGSASTVMIVFAGGGAMAAFNSGTGGINIRSDASFNWSSTTSVTATSDVSLFRDGAADTLAQRRLANPQAFRLYNTTDAGVTNFERGFMRWSSNVLQIGTEKLGTGSARALQFQTDGTARINISATGGIGFYGAAASAQPAAVADATDAATVITQLNSLLSRLRTVGVIAT